jgi:hypothetical protein
MSLTAIVDRHGGRIPAFVVAGLLAIAGALALLAPVVGVVHTRDGSVTAAASAAGWVMLLPAVAVALLAPWRSAAALAAGAGLGIVGASRLFADLSLVLTPQAVARPELWVETTDHALPVTPTAGAYLILAGDLVALAAGVIAAVRFSGLLTLQRDSDFAAGSDRPAGPDFLGGAEAGGRFGADLGDRFERFDRMDRTVRRNNVMTAVGLAGALLLTIGALGVPYTGGYLSARYLPPAVGVSGLVGALVLAVVAATAVLVAGILPRSLALALLGGTALAGAIPLLVAVLAVSIGSTPTHLTVTVWIGLGGAVLLALAGLLARVRFLLIGPADPVDRADRDGEVDVDGDGDDDAGHPPSRALDLAVAGCAILAGGLGVAAFLLPLIDAGGLEDLLFLSDGSPVPGSTVFGAAAVPLLLAGILALVPRTGAIGRAGITVAWAGMVFAATGGLQVLGDDGLSAARSVGLISVGSGAWCGFAAAVVGVVAAVLAILALTRASDSAATIDDDESVGTARAASTPVALVAGVIAVVASCLPLFATAGQISSPTILQGFSIDIWGVWAILLAALAALLAAVLAGRPSVVLGLLLGAALAAAVRLVIPARVSSAAGFALRPGYVVQAVAVAGLLAAALIVARHSSRITRVPVDAYRTAMPDTPRQGTHHQDPTLLDTPLADAGGSTPAASTPTGTAAGTAAETAAVGSRTSAKRRRGSGRSTPTSGRKRR